MSLDPTPGVILHEDTVAEIRLLYEMAKEHQIENVGEYHRGCYTDARYECPHCSASSVCEGDFKHEETCRLHQALLNVGSFLDMQEDLHASG
jgi:hypothetical protein